MTNLTPKLIVVFIAWLECFGQNLKFGSSRQLKQSNSTTAVERLSQFIRLETISDYDKDLHVSNEKVFIQALAYLEEAYPLVWTSLNIQKVNAFSLLIEWQGSNATLLPILFVGHYDVVPVVPETIGEWTYPPFSGEIADGYIWGRGSIDMKSGVIGIFEAINYLLEQGFSPERTIYYGLGHDEEIGGSLGSQAMAEYLREKGVQLEIIFDEGAFNVVDGLGIVQGPLSLVGIAGKGSVSFELDIVGTPGHSSIPPIDGSSVPSIMGRILSRLDADPMPLTLTPPVQQMLKTLAVNAPPQLAQMFLQADNFTLQPMIAGTLAASQVQNPLVRTTASVTRMNTGIADNVLPQVGSMLINYRTLPGEGTAAALEHLQQIIGDDADRVNITQLEDRIYGEPTDTSPWFGPQWDAMVAAIQETMLEDENSTNLVSPFLVLALTDSRHYLDLSRHGVYRYIPQDLYESKNDQDRIHGVNERVEVDDIPRMVTFYSTLISLFDQM
eukprot:TRINITY_DN10094_c0_g5_i1.p1 TRINITY_DN10094_c0_g5~~TRINITY_DN10094_c0_g5_i1.p1  ORF type:complete len:499 (+),score=79.18 TRINITY_DN10094_c0_g5_i1:98-1594(+)